MLLSINRSKILAAMAAFAFTAQLFTLPAIGKMPMAKIGKNNIQLEVAQSDHEIQRGLMYRTSLGKDAGMVFLFTPPRGVRFWMYHTLIPLDMLFIKDGKIIKIIEHVPPCKSENPKNCPTYPPDKDVVVDQVIELNGGYCKNHNVKEGDSVEFDL